MHRRFEIQSISVCLLVLAFGVFGTAQAAVTVGTTSVTSNGALTLTGATASNWTTSAGALTLTAAEASTWSTSAGVLTLTGTGGLTLDSGTTTAVNLGTAASAKTITIGNTTGATGIVLNAGSGDITINGDIRTDRWVSNITNTFFGRSVAGAGTLTLDDGLDDGGALLPAAFDGRNNTYMGFNTGAATTAGGGNTLIGSEAGQAITTGNNLTCVGMWACYNATTAWDGVFVGRSAGLAVTSGKWNVCVGDGSCSSITTQVGNVFVGRHAGYDSTVVNSGDYNIGIGLYALRRLTSGNYNIGIGESAGDILSTGSANVFIGRQAGYSATTSSNNVFLGYFAGQLTTTGNNNVIIGQSAGQNNTGSSNVYIGNTAGQSGTSANSNVYVGASSGNAITTGSENVGVGLSSLFNATTGNSNVALGRAAGNTLTTGGSNVFLGADAGNNASQKVDATNSIAIGKGVFTTQSNQFRVGVDTTLWLNYDGRTTGASAYTRLTMPFLAPTVDDAAGAQYVALLINGGTVTYAGTTTVTGLAVSGVAAGNLILATSGAGITVNGATVFWAKATIPGHANVTLTDSFTYWAGNPNAATGTFTRLHGFFSEAMTRASNNSQFTWQTGGAIPTAATNLVQTAAVDIAAGDARLGIASESGSAIYLGNDRLRFAAGTGYLSIGATDVLALTASKAQVTGLVQNTVQAATCADSGDGNPAACTVQPTSNYVEITCNDANGCTITMSETGAVQGALVTLVNVSANVASFVDTAGVSEIAGAFSAGQYDILQLVYASDRWIETSRSDN